MRLSSIFLNLDLIEVLGEFGCITLIVSLMTLMEIEKGRGGNKKEKEKCKNGGKREQIGKSREKRGKPGNTGKYSRGKEGKNGKILEKGKGREMDKGEKEENVEAQMFCWNLIHHFKTEAASVTDDCRTYISFCTFIAKDRQSRTKGQLKFHRQKSPD